MIYDIRCRQIGYKKNIYTKIVTNNQIQLTKFSQRIVRRRDEQCKLALQLPHSSSARADAEIVLSSVGGVHASYDTTVIEIDDFWRSMWLWHMPHVVWVVVT